MRKIISRSWSRHLKSLTKAVIIDFFSFGNDSGDFFRGMYVRSTAIETFQFHYNATVYRLQQNCIFLIVISIYFQDNHCIISLSETPSGDHL